MSKNKLCLRGSDNYVASSSLHIKIIRAKTSLALLGKVKKSTCMINSKSRISKIIEKQNKIVCVSNGGLREVALIHNHLSLVSILI